MRNLLLAATFSFGTVACTGGLYTAEVTATTPSLVLIEPGLQVVVDSEVPIFYTDNFYWRYQDNTWYRSSYASGGWIRIQVIPQHLRRIERPQQYVRYRPRDHARPVVRDNRPPPSRDHRTPPTEIRDHRAPPPAARPPQQPPVERDHRDKDKNKKDKKDKDKRDNDKHKDHRNG